MEWDWGPSGISVRKRRGGGKRKRRGLVRRRKRASRTDCGLGERSENRAKAGGGGAGN